MNFKYLFLVAVLIVTGVTWSFGDSGTVAPRKAAPLKKSDGAEPVDRKLEIRAGPRVTQPVGQFTVHPVLLGGDINRSGQDRVRLKDLGLDQVSVGAQLDIDWQPFEKWHALLGYKFDKMVKSKTLDRDLTFGGALFANGTNLKTDATLHQIDYTLGYDVYRDATFKVMPFLGGKVAVWDLDLKGTRLQATAFSGNDPATYGQVPYSRTDSGWFPTYEGGFDFKVNVTRSYYIGITPSASGLSNWYMVQGQFYTGYDFNKSWGVRAGFDATYENYSKNDQKIEGGLGAVYVQAVYGF